MNHLLKSSEWVGAATSRALRGLLYSTKTPKPTSSKNAGDSLILRVSRAGNPKISIIPVLNQWLDEGKQVKPSDLQSIIRTLRHYGRFNHALEISEWMSKEMNQTDSPGGFAVQLDLISKVHGLEKAEKYFNYITETKCTRSFKVYSALLNCYAQNKCLEKAETTMQHLREFGLIEKDNPLPYNLMLKLYSQLGKHEKLDILMKEMEELGINFNAFTINTRLNAYVSTSDVEGMETFLGKMEADSSMKMGWNSYVVAADGYWKAGLAEKSVLMLKRAEQLITDKMRKSAYEILLTQYAARGRKAEVYRIWSLYKRMGKFFNTGYLCMISSLVKLGDLSVAEDVFEEWESGYAMYDDRIPNVLISAYCKSGLLEKAEAVVNGRGKEADSFMWHSLATAYKMRDQMPKAVEAMKKALSASSPSRKLELSPLTVTACVEYLKGQGEIEAVENLMKLLNVQGYNKLVDKLKDNNLTAIAIEKSEGDDSLLHQIDGDDDTLDLDKVT